MIFYDFPWVSYKHLVRSVVNFLSIIQTFRTHSLVRNQAPASVSKTTAHKWGPFFLGRLNDLFGPPAGCWNMIGPGSRTWGTLDARFRWSSERRAPKGATISKATNYTWSAEIDFCSFLFWGWVGSGGRRSVKFYRMWSHEILVYTLCICCISPTRDTFRYL